MKIMNIIHVLPGLGVAALILGDIGITRLGGNLFPLTFEDEINGRDFVLGLDGVVGDMVNGNNKLGYGEHSFHKRADGRSPMT